MLITGHTGFKGSWLSLWLCELGAIVTGISLEPEGELNLFMQLHLAERLDHHIADICNQSALQEIVLASDPEVVIHLAAQPFVLRSYRDPLGTWATNVQGSLNVLEALKPLQHPCAVVMVTTDKVYENQEWYYGYRENDRIGGHDPYSASKAAAELAIASWRFSFCGSEAHQTPHLSIATARSGNCLGGGDWGDDIVPYTIRNLVKGLPIRLRRPEATRPWQHVLEPLCGYLMLAERLLESSSQATRNLFAEAFNFGPHLESNRTVRALISEVLLHWPGAWEDISDSSAPHEACRLHIRSDKAYHQLGWEPRWSFATTVAQTISWYQYVNENESRAEKICLENLDMYLGSPEKPGKSCGILI